MENAQRQPEYRELQPAAPERPAPQPSRWQRFVARLRPAAKEQPPVAAPVDGAANICEGIHYAIKRDCAALGIIVPPDGYGTDVRRAFLDTMKLVGKLKQKAGMQ